MGCISYKGGYKYQMNHDYMVVIPIKPGADIATDYIQLTQTGELTVKNGYAWDGPSGPTFDTKNFMRGSLVHDALYQLMRNKHLKKETYREPADDLIRDMCKEDGMSSVRAWFVHRALRIWGDGAASEDKLKRLIHAPKKCDNKDKDEEE